MHNKGTTDFINPPLSYWIDSTSFNNYPKLESDMKTEVVIVGGGIAGITTAYLLKQEGVKVILIEADRILHKTTGHTTAKITSQHNLMRFAEKYFEIDKKPYRWSTQDCMTMDSVPYIGNYTSNTPNIYVATGFGKWGMTNGTVAGMLLTDIITKGKSEWEDIYNPSRFSIGASIKKFMAENADVAKEFVSAKMERR